MVIFLTLSARFYETDKEKFPIFFDITTWIALVLIFTLSINIGFIQIIKDIRILIDKKRNPEKYKALAEMHREIDKMMTELDEEIEKIMKEKNDGQ